MARVLNPHEANDDGTYSRLSHMTGSLRYMAPEVALGLPYHASCDVYSLSLVVWEMLALQRPYQSAAGKSAAGKDEVTFQRKVFEGRCRPPLPSRWPSSLRELLAGGWAHDLRDRIDVSRLCAGLLSELARLRTEDDDAPPAVAQQHQHQHGQARPNDHRCRRRSTYVYCALQTPFSDDPTFIPHSSNSDAVEK
jgi:serine/threonine protein kinase